MLQGGERPSYLHRLEELLYLLTFDEHSSSDYARSELFLFLVNMALLIVSEDFLTFIFKFFFFIAAAVTIRYEIGHCATCSFSCSSYVKDFTSDGLDA